MGMADVLSKAWNTGRAYASWIGLRYGAGGVTQPHSNGRHKIGPETAGTHVPHLLLFASEFPPAIRGGVYRPASLTKYAIRAGWRVTVSAGPLTRQPSTAGLELLSTIPPAVQVFRAALAPPTSYKLLPKVDGGFDNIIPSLRVSVKACQHDPPTVILATGPPFMSFISAYFVARRLCVPLVLEYRDEWTVHTPPFVDVSGFDKRWEPKLLRFAWKVVFVTEASRNAYLASIDGLDASKCVVVPNGWGPEDFEAEPVPWTKDTDRFVISFVGTTGPYSDPTRFLSQLREVLLRSPWLRQKLTVRFTGPKSAESQGVFSDFQKQFPDSIILCEGVPKSAAIAEMRGADAVLLLLQQPCHETAIPGKFYEYMATDTPILAFDDTGPAAALVRRLDAGLVVPANDSSFLESALHRLLREPREQWAKSERAAWAADHTRSSQATRMLKFLSQSN